MSKNIIIFSDGTGQDGGMRPEQRMSNVYKLYRACRVGPGSSIDPREQVAFYDPGLGTDISATAMSAPIRFVQKLLSSVTGRGITTNITDCYEFIINHYEQGDRIFLIGFSRGAYTVRCVANLLMLCGVPTMTPSGILPKFRKITRDIAEEAVMEVFEHGAGHPRVDYEDERFEKARRFRDKYGAKGNNGDVSNAAPHFVGVFDTVAALGANGAKRILVGAGLVAAGLFVVSFASKTLSFFSDWDFLLTFISVSIIAVVFGLWNWLSPAFKSIRDFPKKGDYRSHFAMWKGKDFDRLLSGHVGYARSANAIDETRADFARVGWGNAAKVRARVGDEPQPLVQLWFAGNHSDVGGSYSEVESRLSDIALTWMIEQAIEIPNPLKIGPVIVNGKAMIGTGPTGEPLHTYPAADGVQHSEVAGMRDTIDSCVPRLFRPFSKRWNWEEKIRDIQIDAPMHPTVTERFRLASVTQCGSCGPYRPSALSNHHAFKALYADETAKPSG